MLILYTRLHDKVNNVDGVFYFKFHFSLKFRKKIPLNSTQKHRNVFCNFYLVAVCPSVFTYNSCGFGVNQHFEYFN